MPVLVPSARMRRAALACVAFALGLASSGAALRAVALRNESPSRGALEHLAARGAKYDVIVFGPSFVQMHFVPPVFDERMKELGHPVRSFGFGMSGLRGGELDYYLARVLELELPRLRYVLTDVTLDQDRPIERSNRFKRRVIYWHDPAQLAFMQRIIYTRTDDPHKRNRYLWRHAQHALLKAGNVGEGIEGLRQGTLLGKQPKLHSRAAFHMNAARGKKQLKEAARYLKRNEKRFAKKAKKLAKIRANPLKKGRNSGFARDWRDRVREAGLEPYFVITPVLGSARLATAVPGDEPLRVLDFNDPTRFPELYDPSLHYDQSHFHWQGAVLFSRKLAETFAAELDARARKGGR